MILERPTLYINGRFLGQRLTGVQRYALETLIALDTCGSNSRCRSSPAAAGS
jgi:hypothetical protein